MESIACSRKDKAFGSHIKIFADKNIFETGEYRVKINWSCLGSVSIEEAREFNDNLSQAIEYAQAVRDEYVIEGLVEREWVK